MESPHWTSIGRDLARHTADMNKGQRVAHMRNCAASLGLSPHTVRRFMVLAQFVEKLGISGPQMNALPIGTMEIIYRIHDHDPSRAKAALADLLRGALSYGDALKHLDRVKANEGDRPESTSVLDQVQKRIAELIGMDNPESLVDLHSIDTDPYRLSRSNCIYKVEDKVISYISEPTMIAENQRGMRNLSRIIILSACESDIVVVEFASFASFRSFQKHVAGVRQDVKNRIRVLDVV